MYLIDINEEQRKALLQLVKDNPYYTKEGNALEYWVEMLTTLPIDQAEMERLNVEYNDGKHNPIVHGFCL